MRHGADCSSCPRRRGLSNTGINIFSLLCPVCLINLPSCYLSERGDELSHLSPRHTMQLKVNRRQQKQEKVHFYPFFSSFLTRGFVYRSPLKFPPPLPSSCCMLPPPSCCFFAFPDNVMQVDNIEDEQSRCHRGGGCCTGEVKKYSFQIGFSPPFAIC